MTQLFGEKMEIKVLPLGAIEANCYLLSTDKSAIVIDPGFYSQEVLDFLKSNSDKERLILLTHGHFDHIGGADVLRKETDTKIGIGVKDAPYLSDSIKNLSAKFGMPVEPFSADVTFKDNETFTIGDITFKVIETGGHTKGGVCYLCDNYLFTGDTLFHQSIGRTDFFDGNFNEIKKSIEKLYTLDPNIIIYAGHGDQTTIGFEKKYNPFVRG
jgi:glyoxylase-like metal-dependent hydrolase (beta-lactamase superfamily II)